MGFKISDWMKQINITLLDGEATTIVTGKTIIYLLDTLVRNGLYTSRSEAIRNYISKGLRDDLEFLDTIQKSSENIEEQEVEIEGEVYQILRRLE
jgi:Arc/MetJ-type ribon-helix-helix transcriptional regulator